MKIEIDGMHDNAGEMRLLSKFLLELADHRDAESARAWGEMAQRRASGAVLGTGAAMEAQSASLANAPSGEAKSKGKVKSKQEPAPAVGNVSGAAAPTEQAPAAPAASTSEPTTAPSDPAALTPEQEKAIERGDTVALSQAQVAKIVSDAEKAIDPAKLRTEIRSVLTPLMTSDKAIKVQELIAQFGGSVSKCADENLPALLVKAKELA